MKNASSSWIRIPVIFFTIFGLMEYFIDSGDMPAIIKYPAAQFFMLMVLLIAHRDRNDFTVGGKCHVPNPIRRGQAKI